MHILLRFITINFQQGIIQETTWCALRTYAIRHSRVKRAAIWFPNRTNASPWDHLKSAHWFQHQTEKI